MKTPAYLLTFGLLAVMPAYAQNPGAADLPTPAPAEKAAESSPAEKSAVGEADPVDVSAEKVPPKLDTNLSANLTLFEIASGFEGFTTLMGAVEAAGLEESLKGEGPHTIFAPTNAAFEKLPEGVLESLLLPENQDVLKDLLNFHIIKGKRMAAELKPGDLATLKGENVRLEGISQGGITVQGANITQTDVAGKNGVIHVVDQVLLPPTFVIEDYSPDTEEETAGEDATEE